MDVFMATIMAGTSRAMLRHASKHRALYLPHLALCFDHGRDRLRIPQNLRIAG